jgi:hypothetical protein
LYASLFEVSELTDHEVAFVAKQAREAIVFSHLLEDVG